MKLRGVLFVAAVVLSSAAVALAHHSFAAEYDANKPVKVTGAVTKIEWQNPHVYFYTDVRDEKTGRVTNWAWEMGAPAVIARRGWTRTTMKIGDLVIVEGSQAKSGKPHGNARTVTMAKTGQVLGAGSSQGDPAPDQ